MAGIINASKIRKLDMDSKIIINGAGASGINVCKILLQYGFTNITMLDTKGAIYEGRLDNMNQNKEEISKFTNPKKIKG